MSRYILDTNHASGVMELGPLHSRITAATGNQFFLPTPVLGELWYMVCYSSRILANTQRLDEMLQLLPVIAYDTDEAAEFGRVRAELRRQGKPIPQIDAQIAATARVHDLIVLTADAHFRLVSQLKTENWLIPQP